MFETWSTGSRVALGVLLVVILILTWLIFTKKQTTTGTATASPTSSSPPGAVPANKYNSLLAILPVSMHWVYFDEQAKARQTMDFTLNTAAQTLTIKASVAAQPATFNYSQAQGRDDTMQLLDPTKGDASKYVMLIMYVDDKDLVVEEKTNGKITFQQKINS